MQPNVISDVESIIHKALSLERTSRRHLTSSFDAERNHSMTKDLSKSSSINSQYTFIDLSRSNSASLFISSSQCSKLTNSDASKENEMAV
jgi:hypothetical protein